MKRFAVLLPLWIVGLGALPGGAYAQCGDCSEHDDPNNPGEKMHQFHSVVLEEYDCESEEPGEPGDCHVGWLPKKCTDAHATCEDAEEELEAIDADLLQVANHPTPEALAALLPKADGYIELIPQDATVLLRGCRGSVVRIVRIPGKVQAAAAALKGARN